MITRYIAVAIDADNRWIGTPVEDLISEERASEAAAEMLAADPTLTRVRIYRRRTQRGAFGGTVSRGNIHMFDVGRDGAGA